MNIQLSGYRIYTVLGTGMFPHCIILRCRAPYILKQTDVFGSSQSSSWEKAGLG